MTFGERPTCAPVQPDGEGRATSRVPDLLDPAAGSYFLDAILDGCKDLRKRTAASPVSWRS
jgi:hypothetical protein